VNHAGAAAAAFVAYDHPMARPEESYIAVVERPADEAPPRLVDAQVDDQEGQVDVTEACDEICRLKTTLELTTPSSHDVSASRRPPRKKIVSVSKVKAARAKAFVHLVLRRRERTELRAFLKAHPSAIARVVLRAVDTSGNKHVRRKRVSLDELLGR
jgi:hypothetical protein